MFVLCRSRGAHLFGFDGEFSNEKGVNRIKWIAVQLTFTHTHIDTQTQRGTNKQHHRRLSSAVRDGK